MVGVDESTEIRRPLLSLIYLNKLFSIFFYLLITYLNIAFILLYSFVCLLIVCANVYISSLSLRLYSCL